MAYAQYSWEPVTKSYSSQTPWFFKDKFHKAWLLDANGNPVAKLPYTGESVLKFQVTENCTVTAVELRGQNGERYPVLTGYHFVLHAGDTMHVSLNLGLTW